LQEIIKLATHDKADGYIMKNNLLHRDNGDDLLIVSKTLQNSISVKQAHEKGHFGVSQTEALLLKDYWFKGMRPRIEKVVTGYI